jgi:hypothetical protein
MKRLLFHLIAALSLLLSLTAAAAWAASYAWPLDWHLLGVAHSADLTRASSNQRTVVFMGTVNGSNLASHGYWDALWVRSHAGSVTLVAHAIDYEGSLHRISASPPSLVVDLSGATPASVVVGIPESRGWSGRLGFAWHHDAEQSVDDQKSASLHARLITMPYWFVGALSLTPFLLWLRIRGSAG